MRWLCIRNSGESAIRTRGILIILLLIPAVVIGVLVLVPTPPPHSGKPPTDILKSLNRTTLRTPADQRAWPVYEQVFLAIDADDDNRYDQSYSPGHLRPIDPCWPATLARLERHRSGLTQIHDAAQRSHFGWLYVWPGQGLDSDHWRDQLLLSVGTPNACRASRAVLDLVSADIYSAAEARDFERVARGLETLHLFAVQLSELAFTYERIHCQSTMSFRNQVLGELFAWHPEALREPSIDRVLMHLEYESQLSVFDGRDSVWLLQNLLEVTFTDDGKGGGRATRLWTDEELLDLLPVLFLEDTHRVTDDLPQAIGGKIGGAIGAYNLWKLKDREQQAAALNEILECFERDRQTPVRDLPLGDAHAQLYELRRNGYLPVGAVVPWFHWLRRFEQRYVAESEATIAVLKWHRLGRPDGDPTERITPWPIDPMDGQPMRWRIDNAAGGLMLYSVGDDLDDDGGRPTDHAGMPEMTFDESVESDDGDWLVFPPHIEGPWEIVPVRVPRDESNTTGPGGMGMGGMGMGMGMGEEPDPVPATNTPSGYRIDCGHEACRAFYGIQVEPENDGETSMP